MAVKFCSFMYNVEKQPNILVYTARFLQYVWLFFNIIHERVEWLIRERLYNKNYKYNFSSEKRN